MINWTFFELIILILVIEVEYLSASASNSPNFPLPNRFKGADKVVFNEYTQLVQQYNALDMGSGNPNFTPDNDLKKHLEKIIASKDYSLSQYSPNAGQPRLQRAVANFYSKLTNQTLDPDDNVLITVGGTEALFAAFQTNTFPGEEWILIEPVYSYYIPMVTGAQGIPRYIALKPMKTTGNISSADWSFDRQEMENLFNEKTKGIVVNTPHNPLGKMFDYDELSFIAELAKKWNTLVISDEVYEFLSYDKNKHISIATLPGMYERTIVIGSACKAFSATGYRIGWAYGDGKLLENLKTIHAIAVESSVTPIQEAIAIALEHETKNYGKPTSYLETLREATESGRNRAAEILSDFGMTPIIPQGGYYLVANWTTLDITLDGETGDDKAIQFMNWFVKNVGVFVLPLTGFYGESNAYLGNDLVRFVIIRDNETFVELKNRVDTWKSEHST